jgi:hypothetical protein
MCDNLSEGDPEFNANKKEKSLQLKLHNHIPIA